MTAKLKCMAWNLYYPDGKLRYITHHLTSDGKVALCKEPIPDTAGQVSWLDNKPKVCGQCTTRFEEMEKSSTKTPNKFLDTSLVLTDENILEEMMKFISYLAGRWCTENPMFDFDEITGELQVELVQSMRYYQPRIADMEQMKATLRRCLDNRIAELRHRYFGTHRVKATLNISIQLELEDDVELGEILPDDCGSPEDLALSYERVEITRNRLSNTARKVFDALVFGDERLATMVWLATIRKCATKPLSTAIVKPWMVGEVVGAKEQEVKIAIEEIAKVYAEVNDGY